VNTWVQPQFFVRFVLLNLQFSLYYFVDHCSFSFCHFIVCPSIYCFWWWPLLYLLIMTPLVSSDDEFLGIFWWWAPWYLLMITPLVSSDDDLLGIFWWWPPRYLLMMTPLVSSDDDPLGIFWWWPPWYQLINIGHSKQWCLNRQVVKPLDVMLNLCFFASTWLFCLLFFLIAYTPERYLIPLRSVRITWDVKNIAVTSHDLSHLLF
jgi:hypothetical protein